MRDVDLRVGDCLRVLRTMPDACIDLTVTSPPYDSLRAYHGYTFDFEGIARELYRVTKPGGVVVWVVGDATVKGSETGTSFRQALYFKDVCGFNLHDTMIYQKCPPPSIDIQHARYYQHFEYMFVLSKGRPGRCNFLREPKKFTESRTHKAGQKTAQGEQTWRPTNPAADKVRGNVWYYHVGLHGSTSDREAFQHPAIFPETLARDHIISWSNPGDTVLDCFLGSGTTGKAAVQLGRRFVGIEISAEYMKIARARIAAAQAELLKAAA
jgi:site-specific DNA-methyltransferase (adenine-specific)